MPKAVPIAPPDLRAKILCDFLNGETVLGVAARYTVHSSVVEDSIRREWPRIKRKARR